MLAAGHDLRNDSVHYDRIGSDTSMPALSGESDFVPHETQRVVARVRVPFGPKQAHSFAEPAVELDYWMVAARVCAVSGLGSIPLTSAASAFGPPTSSQVRRMISMMDFN